MAGPSARSAAAATRTKRSAKPGRLIGDGRSAILHFELNDDFAQENGLICGGRMDVHVDPLLPDPPLFIVGAGHVGFQLARIAADAGFRLTVVDDREKFANAERFPGADGHRRTHPGLAASRRHPGVRLRRGR